MYRHGDTWISTIRRLGYGVGVRARVRFCSARIVFEDNTNRELLSLLGKGAGRPTFPKGQ